MTNIPTVVNPRAPKRMVGCELLNLAAHRQRNADAVSGKAVDKVGGAIQWIDDPDKFGVFGTVLLARFFGQDAVAGVGTQQGFDDGFFAGVIDFGDKVVDLLLRNAHRFHV